MQQTNDRWWARARRAYVLAVMAAYLILLRGYASPHGASSQEDGELTPTWNPLILYLGRSNAALSRRKSSQATDYDALSCDTLATIQNCVHETRSTLGAEFFVTIATITVPQGPFPTSNDPVAWISRVWGVPQLPPGDLLLLQLDSSSNTSHDAAHSVCKALFRALADSGRWREIRFVPHGDGTRQMLPCTGSYAKSQVAQQKARYERLVLSKATYGLSPAGDDTCRVAVVAAATGEPVGGTVGTGMLFHNEDVVVLPLSEALHHLDVGVLKDVARIVHMSGFWRGKAVNWPPSSNRTVKVDEAQGVLGERLTSLLQWLISRNAAPSTVVLTSCDSHEGLEVHMEWRARPFSLVEAETKRSDPVMVPSPRVVLHRRTTVICMPLGAPIVSRRLSITPSSMDVGVGTAVL